MFEVFEHTADMGLRVTAPNVAELFVDAARGLFSLIVANLEQVRPVQMRTYRLAGDELDYLMFDWLRELLLTFESERLLWSEFQVSVGDGHLTAVCRGEPLDAARHEMEHEVKAITYHGLRVEATESGWLAEVIVDI